MKKALRKNDEGVSEVVGSILTLSITVTLFAAIFMGMDQLPAPTGNTYANFDLTTKQITLNNGTKATWLNITHKGGETLKDFQTKIYLISSGNPSSSNTYIFSIHDGFSDKRTEWKTGEIWSKKIYGDVDLSSAYVMIVDTSRSTVIWRGDLSSGVSQPLPPIIMDRGTTPTPISKSSTFRFYAYVKDPNNDFKPGEDGSSLVVSFPRKIHLRLNSTIVSSVNLTHDIGYRYVSPELNASSDTPIGTHFANITATDSTNRTSKEILKFVVEKPTAKGRCDIYISQIIFSPSSPVTGETTSMTVTFVNAGDAYGYFTLVITDQLPNKTSVRIAPEGLGLVYVSAHGESTRTYIWNSKTPVLYPNNGTRTNQIHPPSPAGNHNITVSAVIESGSPEDMNPDNNTATEPLSILPKILLVDDDHNKDFNTAAYMEDALNATGYAYDVYTVAYDTDDGPQYSTLSKYDVVIWMTGKDTTNSLTTTAGSGDVGNLEKFLDGGGKLWLLGEGIMNNADSNGGLKSFINTYMGASKVSLDVTLPAMINGSDPALGNLHNISMQPTGYDNGKYTDYIAAVNTESNASLYDVSNKKAIGISHDTGNYATMFFSFEFSTIKYSSDRAQITYEVLKWLSGISGKTGRDVAIGGVTINPEYPLYKDTVNITINVRNNGWKNETTRVQLIIDGADVPLEKALVDVEKNGGIATTTGTWYANILGLHRVVVRVDPYNEIAESDETNNVYLTQFIVRFRTLIVDDDDSSNNNGGGEEDWTTPIEHAFEHLLSTRDLSSNYSSTADIKIVNSTENGPNSTVMSRYNAVIWITGEDSSYSFTAADVKNISSYIRSGGRIWIIGSGFLNDLDNGVAGLTKTDIDSFLHNLGIFSYSLDADSGFDELHGVLDDEIGHGIDFSMDSSETSGVDSMVPSTNATPIFYGSNGYVGVKTENIRRSVVFTFNPNASTGLANYYPNPHFKIPKDIANRTVYEVTYLVMRWFGEINTNPEMKVGADLYINGEPIDKTHLVVGESYILEAKVHNVGSRDIIYANVRIYDGEHIIASSGVGISAGNVSTVSIVWRPAYAGSARPIRVIVDYHEEVKEIPNPDNLSENLFEYNNEIVHYVPVYFFWDDMENGTANWRHEATIMNINGESPLDFLNRPDVSTNVIGSWDYSYSGSTDKNGNIHGNGDGTYLTTDSSVSNFTHSSSHSSPNAFWMPETPAFSSGRKPLDIIFVIDTSGSMKDPVSGATVGDKNNDGKENTRIDVAIQAAEDAVSKLGDDDRVAIFAFDQNGNGHPEKILDFTQATQTKTIDDKLESLQAKGGTPLYDTVSYATYYMDNNGRTAENGGVDSVKGILVLTDGLSNSDDYGTSNGKKYKYAPGTGNFESEQGVIQNYLNGNGLLNIKYSVMAISIAPDGWDGRLFPIGNSSSGSVSMGLFESDPDAIEGAFTAFIQLLTVSASTGGVRSVNPYPVMTRASEENPTVSDTVSNLGAVVFSDGFRNYTNTPDDANTPGFYGKWAQSDFTITSTGDGNYYKKSQSSSGWTDEYWVAQTGTSGAYLRHTIYPKSVLDYHYPGTYEIKSAEIRFWVGDHGSGSWRGVTPDKASATIKVYAAGNLLATESFDDSKGKSPEKYYTISIPQDTYTEDSYDIKIKVSSVSGGSIGIDDVMVVYYIDYTPPSSGSSTGSSGTVPSDYTKTISTDREYRYLTTPPVDIHTASSSTLSFWTKYWMTEGTNGGVVYLWGKKSGDSSWVWDKDHRYYLTPKQSYTGNLKMGTDDSGNPIGVDAEKTSGGPWNDNGLIDADGNLPYWCFNGRSGHGTFDWEYIEINLHRYIGKFSQVRIVFLLAQFGQISPSMGWNPAMGWYLDDVQVTVTSDGTRDIWQLHDFGRIGPKAAHSGHYAWEYNVSDTSNLPPGIDASLITRPIDLTSALSANLSFSIRFNINNSAGVPPASIRVEVSDDNGMTWNSITYGVRIGWNASGTDKKTYNGKSYSGVLDNGTTGYGWVNASSLMRLNCDLSGYRGQVIMIRIRVVTNATTDSSGAYYPTYQDSKFPFGVFIDDFIIMGESIGSRD